MIRHSVRFIKMLLSSCSMFSRQWFTLNCVHAEGLGYEKKSVLRVNVVGVRQTPCLTGRCRDIYHIYRDFQLHPIRLICHLALRNDIMDHEDRQLQSVMSGTADLKQSFQSRLG